MKKIFYIVIFYPFALGFYSYAVRPVMTKSMQSQYSGLSGRRYHMPRSSTPLVNTYEPTNLDAALLTDDYAVAERIANERNQMFRDDQLARTRRRVYGAENRFKPVH